MPEIDRGVAVAYCDPPGPLETADAADVLRGVADARRTGRRSGSASFYREYNRHMVHNLMVHEAMPGHVLQLRTPAGSPAARRCAPRSGPARSSRAGRSTPRS